MQIQKSIHPNPPLLPFTHESAVLKVRLAEDGWNSRDPERVALATIFQLENQSANIIGPWAAARIITQG